MLKIKRCINIFIDIFINIFIHIFIHIFINIFINIFITIFIIIFITIFINISIYLYIYISIYLWGPMGSQGPGPRAPTLSCKARWRVRGSAARWIDIAGDIHYNMDVAGCLAIFLSRCWQHPLSFACSGWSKQTSGFHNK